MKNKYPKHIFFFTFCILLITSSCKETKKETTKQPEEKKVAEKVTLLKDQPVEIITPEGMVWIPGGIFKQGAVASDQMAMGHEKPAHEVGVDGFFMDISEVTNAQFQEFVSATGYVTVAERKVDWEELKKQVPEGTPKPADSLLQPGSLTFKKAKSTVPNLYDFSQWWKWTIGADWQHPNGPNSSIEGKDNYPVVQISYEDALAYCKWKGRRLPTEAEWEYAARAQNDNAIYFWGDDFSKLSTMANSWEGEFPVSNSKEDGFEFRAPVKSYAPNGFGLYDMAGNVWEWTSDWYNINYYKEMASLGIQYNPNGATAPYNNTNPYAKEKVMKGGSFLCSASYCASYRISARMGSSPDSSLEHLGFRTVASVDMIKK